MNGARTRAMTGNRQRLGEEVGDVADAPDEDDAKMSLAVPVPDPMQAAFDIRCDTVSTAMPMANSLSQNSGVAGWGWPMLAKIFRSSVAMRAAAYKPAYSASARKEQTTGIRVEWKEMGWLTQSSSLVSPVIVGHRRRCLR